MIITDSDKCGFDEMRIKITEALDSKHFKEDCIRRLANSRACPPNDIFNSEKATISLINFYDLLEKDEEKKIRNEIKRRSCLVHVGSSFLLIELQFLKGQWKL